MSLCDWERRGELSFGIQSVWRNRFLHKSLLHAIQGECIWGCGIWNVNDWSLKQNFSSELQFLGESIWAALDFGLHSLALLCLFLSLINLVLLSCRITVYSMLALGICSLWCQCQAWRVTKSFCGPETLVAVLIKWLHSKPVSGSDKEKKQAVYN